MDTFFNKQVYDNEMPFLWSMKGQENMHKIGGVRHIDGLMENSKEET